MTGEPQPKFKVGDRVVFNANLDKSPDPENAKIVGVLTRYAAPGETCAGKDLRPEAAFVVFDGTLCGPIMDDWLEPAPEE